MNGKIKIDPTKLAPQGSFKRAEQDVLIQGMKSTFRERLEWLEEACDFAAGIRERRPLRPAEGGKRRNGVKPPQ